MQTNIYKNKVLSNLLLLVAIVALPTMVVADPSSTPSTTSVTTTTTQVVAPQEMEKCYGIVKAGRNDCDTNNGPGSCVQSVIDADPNYWVYVPKGSCAKIIGGIPESGVKVVPAPGSGPDLSTPQSKNQYLESTDADMRQDFQKGTDMGITSQDDLSTDNETDPDLTGTSIDKGSNPSNVPTNPNNT